jgi:ribosomal protein S18 acetylase RimI-like enzyme
MVQRAQGSVEVIKIEYRPIFEGELPEATQVFVDTLEDLLRRNRVTNLHPGSFEERLEEFRHIFATGIFQVGIHEGKIIALANGIVRDEQWFLSGFWVRPEFQNQGVGHPLLRKLWTEAMTLNPPISFVWASTEYSAVATYLKHDLMPLTSILRFRGKPKSWKESAATGYTTKPIRIESIGKIEQEVRGTRREIEHRFFAHELNAGFQVMRGPACVGYFYCNRGSIGPAAWCDDEHAEAVMSLAVKTALAQHEEIQFVALGVNQRAIRLALSLGLSLVMITNLLANRPFGALDRYLPYGPALF